MDRIIGNIGEDQKRIENNRDQKGQKEKKYQK